MNQIRWTAVLLLVGLLAGLTQPGSAGAQGGRGELGSDGQPETKPQTLTFHFQNTPWDQVLRWLTDAADLNLHVRDKLTGGLSYRDPNQYTPTQALDVMNRLLQQQEFLLLRHDRFLTVLNFKLGIPDHLVDHVSLEELEKRGETEILKVSFPLNDRDGQKTADEIKAILGPLGKVAALESANSILVTGTGRKLWQIKGLFDNNRKLGKEELTFKPFKLRYIAAADAEQIVRSLFSLQSGVQNVSAGQSGVSSSSGRSRWSSRRRGSSSDDRRRAFFERMRSGSRGGFGRGGESGVRGGTPSRQQPNQQRNANEPQVTVTIVEATNTLLVNAGAAKMKVIEQVVQAIDVNSGTASGPGGFSSPSDNKPYFNVYQLENADAQEVARSLGVLHPGLVVNEDGRRRRIHIYANPEQHQKIAEDIRLMDGDGTVGETLARIPLSGISAVEAANMLFSLYVNVDKDDAPSFQSDPSGKNLIMRGTGSQVSQARLLLSQYGRGTEASFVRQTGPVRTIPLGGGRSAAEVANTLKRILETAIPNSIEVINPSAPNQDRPAQTPPGQPRRTNRRRPRDADRRPRSDAVRSDAVRRDASLLREKGLRVLTASQTSSGPSDQPADGPTDQPDDQPPAKPDDASGQPADDSAPTSDSNDAQKPASQQKPPAARLVIHVDWDNLKIISQDEKLLDYVQGILNKVMSSMPAKTSWSVFYLQSADATETSVMLQQLMPSSTTSSLLAGTNGLVAAASSTGLRIVPETRTNALFVTGPTALVQDVRNWLKVLDTDEADLPASLRSRIPRMIPVRYASVNQVAEIVREVYSDSMQLPRSGGDRSRFGDNPFDRFRSRRSFSRESGRSNGNNSSRNNNTVRLTLGVDTQNSQLVVSSSDALFQQIKELVATLDESSYQAQPTVSVYALNNANSAIVQQALGSLFPQVTVSTTQTTNSSNNNRRNSRSNNTDRNRSFGGIDSERFRRRFGDRGSSGFRGGGDRSRWFRGNGGDSQRGGNRGSSSDGNRGRFWSGNRSGGSRRGGDR